MEEIRQEFKIRVQEQANKVTDDMIDKRNKIDGMQGQLEDTVNNFRKDIELMKSTIRFSEKLECHRIKRWPLVLEISQPLLSLSVQQSK